MIVLSERLQAIADYIEPGEKVADIGTDHGYIPIYLKQKKVSDLIIASDINSGPLEKMNDNFSKYFGEDREKIIARRGSGISVLSVAEVDSIIIAGMGGLLIIDILENNIEKTKSFSKLILQPRNALDKLRKWLLTHGFDIEDEILVREGNFIWEILKAVPNKQGQTEAVEEDFFYEIGTHLVKKKDPLLREYLKRKISVEEKIIENTSLSKSDTAVSQNEKSKVRLEKFKEVLKIVNKS